MGWTIGIPSLKLNNVGMKSKHCGNFRSVAEEALQERKGHDPDINPMLSARNIYTGYTSAAALLDYSRNHCEHLTDSLGRSLRKDAVRMCVTIIKPPAAFMETLSERDQQLFLQDGVDKLTEIIGPSNIRSTAWHYDEQGPHVHVFWEPITTDGRLCAKEMHNLTFLGRLNHEMPIHLREKGWDIDDCNAYDAAEEALKTEKEKTEHRQKNGRSSAAYKAAAERELHTLQKVIEQTRNELEESIYNFAQDSIDAVIADSDRVYENALFLLQECDEEYFEQLSQEGAALKAQLLRDALARTNIKKNVDILIANAKAQPQTLSWQERQKRWDSYRELSREFWDLRSELNADYNNALNEAYTRKRNAARSFYDAKYLLFRSNSIIISLIAFVWALVSISRESKYDAQITAIKKERDILLRNTASFMRYSDAYKKELKNGQMPFESYLNSIESLVEEMDKEAIKHRTATKHQTYLPQKNTKLSR